jgi:hypothetical protein
MSIPPGKWKLEIYFDSRKQPGNSAGDDPPSASKRDGASFPRRQA